MLYDVKLLHKKFLLEYKYENTFGDACGTVVVSGSNNSYYVATHHRYSPYVTTDKLAN